MNNFEIKYVLPVSKVSFAIESLLLALMSRGGSIFKSKRIGYYLDIFWC